MKKLVVFLLLFLLSNVSNAYTKTLSCGEFAEDINLEENKSVILSGEHGSLQIFFEKAKQKKNDGRVTIKYNNRELGFPNITNYIITKNQQTVVAKKDNNYYLTALKKSDKESFVIAFCDNVVFKFEHNKILVKKEKEQIYIKEGIYHRDKRELSIIEDGKVSQIIKI